MSLLNPRYRSEPPLTSPGRRPGVRIEPPLTAAAVAGRAAPAAQAETIRTSASARTAAPAEPRRLLAETLQPSVASPSPFRTAPRHDAAWPDAPAPREAIPAAPSPSATPANADAAPSGSIFRAAPPHLLRAMPAVPTGRPIVAQPDPYRLLPGARPTMPQAGAAEPGRPAPPISAVVRPEPAVNSLRRAPARPRDPAPSRLSYRMHRLWLTPVYRAMFRVGLPAFALAFGVGFYLSDEDRRAALAGQGESLVRSVQERPEFMVTLMAIEGASPALGEAIRAALPLEFPVTSFDLDLEEMRQTVAALDAVAAADLRIRPGGILEVRVAERVPVILWRGPGGLALLDATGHLVTPVASRLERPDLPVIAGEGAEAAVAEALRLIEAAEPVAARLRGLVRMGNRRWDVVLDNGQRILLPEENALAALERVMALAVAEDMLERDVTVIDMRYGARPTLRLSPRALDQMRGREIATGATSG